MHPNPPGVARRVQPSPLYELNFVKDGMQLINEGAENAYMYRNPEEKEVESLFDTHFHTDSQGSKSLENSSVIKEGSSKFPISKEEFQQVCRGLPSRYQFYQWRIVFDTAIHGYSLSHFYRCMNETYSEEAGAIGIFLVQERGCTPQGSDVGTSGDSATRRSRSCTSGVIGCFTPVVPCEFLIGVAHAGSPETQVFFLDSSRPKSASPKRSRLSPSPAGPSPSTNRRVQWYQWCKEAEHNRFMRCDASSLSIGGGEGGPALWVDQHIQNGLSSRFCDTFHSPSLFGTAADSLSHSEFRVERMMWVAMDMKHVLHVDETDPHSEGGADWLQNSFVTPLWTMMNNPTEIEQQLDYQ